MAGPEWNHTQVWTKTTGGTQIKVTKRSTNTYWWTVHRVITVTECMAMGHEASLEEAKKEASRHV